MEVNIYIIAKHTGHLKKGMGTYGIVLEYIKNDGTPETREIFKGFKNTTNNRTALKACVDSLEHLIKQCKVAIFINSYYITEPFNQGWIQEWDIDKWTNKGKPVKNVDLWKQLLKQKEKHSITFEYSLSNPYSDYLETMMKRINIEYQEDEGNV